LNNKNESVDSQSHGGGNDTPPGEAVREIDFSEFAPADYNKWKESAVVALKGTPFEKSMYTPTYEGITLEPLYTAEHASAIEAPKSFPGVYNFARGGKASGYISKPWEIAQPSDALSPADANVQIRRDLEKGATTLSLLLDGSSLLGLDADVSDAGWESGLSVSTLSDMESLFDSIDLTRYPIHIYAGASSTPLIGLAAALAERRGILPDRLRGCIGADPLGSWLQNGGIFCDADQLFDEMAHAIFWTEKHMPAMRTVLIRGSIVHNGGGSAIQEVGCAIAETVETFRNLRTRQISIDMFARHLRFEFSLSSNFFMEIAKIRAAREVWA
jgi:methylmalonyl-CoA mutase